MTAPMTLARLDALRERSSLAIAARRTAAIGDDGAEWLTACLAAGRARREADAAVAQWIAQGCREVPALAEESP